MVRPAPNIHCVNVTQNNSDSTVHFLVVLAARQVASTHAFNVTVKLLPSARVCFLDPFATRIGANMHDIFGTVKAFRGAAVHFLVFDARPDANTHGVYASVSHRVSGKTDTQNLTRDFLFTKLQDRFSIQIQHLIALNVNFLNMLQKD